MNEINAWNNHLDSRQVRAFAMLAKTGSFTKAAKILKISQSAVSHSIRVLEEDLGCLLLDRVGKKVFLTHYGEQFKVRAERILDEMSLARSEIKTTGPWGHSRLRLSATPTACQYLLPGVLREFKECFPLCSILIEPGDSPNGVDLLRQNRVDLVLAIEPPEDPLITFRKLFVDELFFVTSPLHPWAEYGLIRRSTISEQKYILYNRKSFTFELIKAYFDEENLTLDSVIELGSMDAIKELVKLGLGVGVSAKWIVQRELREGSLAAVSMGKRKLKRRWGLFHWKSRKLNLVEETFAGLCKSVVENIPSLA